MLSMWLEHISICEVTRWQEDNIVPGQPGFINSMALVKVLPCAKFL